MPGKADNFVETIHGKKMFFTKEASIKYANGEFMAGTVEGCPIDDMFLCINREWDENFFLMLREDEAAAIINVLSAVIQKRRRAEMEKD